MGAHEGRVLDAVLQFVTVTGHSPARAQAAALEDGGVAMFQLPRLRTILSRAAMLAAVLLLAGCATGGYGGYPGDRYPGGGYPGGYPGGYGSQRVVGTVEDLDLYNGRLLLRAEDRYSGGRSLEVRFDRNVPVVYQGQQVAVDGLERGDGVSIDVETSGGRYWARRIDVVRNVRDPYGGGGYGDSYGGDLQGAVDYVDAQRRLIVLARGGYGGAREQVYYDGNTMVEYGGRLYRPDQLERDDLIRVEARRWNNGWLAERIRVEVDVRSR